ncbi:thioesterase domain-containing protein [Niveibacterium sp. SC-1]|uniref:thioesterase domain-containing protein n=1 Tax=Niveibacterium sp. SC-1 TaxID=3135646 RepID=UPI00312049FE
MSGASGASADSPDLPGLDAYLHTHIPLSGAMQVRARAWDGERLTLAAPIAPNINHKATAFGGSVSTLAILSAWSLLHLRLRDAGLAVELVIQRNQVEYLAPIAEDFEATATLAPEANWARFEQVLRRRGRARITVHSEVRCDGSCSDAPQARFSGEFVALLRAGH